MDSNQSIKLPNELELKCLKYGFDRARRYYRREDEASRSVSTHGADSDPLKQAYAKMAEVAFCLRFDLDPIASLNWVHKPDDYDLMFCGKRFDLKHTPRGEYLIWPLGKNHLFGKKHFDVLALIIGMPETGFVAKGWISKRNFAERCEIAGVGHRLTPGTRCLRQELLWPFELNQSPMDARDAIAQNRVVEYIIGKSAPLK